MNERALRPERIRRLTLTGAASLVARRMNKQEGFQNRALVPALVLTLIALALAACDSAPPTVSVVGTSARPTPAPTQIQTPSPTPPRTSTATPAPAPTPTLLPSPTPTYPGFPIWAVFRLKGQPKRDSGIIFGSCKASQSPVYPIRDAILAVNHVSCPSLSSSGPREWGESALKTSRLPGALSLLARSWLYPPSAWRRR